MASLGDHCRHRLVPSGTRAASVGGTLRPHYRRAAPDRPQRVYEKPVRRVRRGRDAPDGGVAGRGQAEGTGMSEVIITLDGHDEELAVFGSRDQYLRQVRDGLGVKVLARHGEVRVDGDREKVELARTVFEELRTRHRARRAVTS